MPKGKETVEFACDVCGTRWHVDLGSLLPCPQCGSRDVHISPATAKPAKGATHCDHRGERGNVYCGTDSAPWEQTERGRSETRRHLDAIHAFLIGPRADPATTEPAKGKYTEERITSLHGNPTWEAIWSVVRRWDISRNSDGMYAGASGDDVTAIYDAVLAAKGAGRTIGYLLINPFGVARGKNVGWTSAGVVPFNEGDMLNAVSNERVVRLVADDEER